MHEKNKHLSPPQPPAINRQLWLRFLTIAKPYWVSVQRWSQWAGLGLLVILLVLQTVSSVLFNRESGEFISALADQDGSRFWSSIWRYGYILTAAIPIYSFFYFSLDTISLRWRKWLTDHFMQRYFKERAYYQLGQTTTIDNPDQRIAEDINTFTLQSLFFATVIVGSVIQIIAFGGVLWSISPNLIYFLIGYSAFSSWFTAAVFGKPLIGLNFLQLQRETDFRFGLVRVREHSEPIAFYDGEVREITLLQRMFALVFQNQQRVLRWKLKLNLFQFTHNFLTAVIPTVIIANDVLSGRLEVGLAVQAAGAFASMLIALTVYSNKGLMIVGESGTGKSSLLRVIAGLWSTGSGEIVRPSRHELHFLPQQPYHPLGDLRCQLSYPQVRSMRPTKRGYIRNCVDWTSRLLV